MEKFKVKVVSDVESWKEGSTYTYVCKACGKEAEEVHDKPECRRCRDWFGCGKKCTLSALKCTSCGISEST